jgi:hypothetical protein
MQSKRSMLEFVVRSLPAASASERLSDNRSLALAAGK